MNSFIHGKLEGAAISNGTAATLSAVEKANGREIALQDTDPAILDNLRNTSVVTSAEASCAIEGIIIPADRADAVLNNGETPKTRDERQIANYKKALERVFKTPRGDLTPDLDTILGFHNLIMAGEPGAGELKQANNAIYDVAEGKRRLRFTPVDWKNTEEFLAQLCVEYTATVSKKLAPDLLAITAFALDFTCIHPFADGNGRLSRLLTTACLINQGYELPRYISLDTIIDERKDFYYAALKSSSEGWHTQQHTVMSFFRFQLETLLEGYGELERRKGRRDKTLTILINDEIPSEAINAAMAELKKHFPMAQWESANDLSLSNLRFKIKGDRPDLPKAEWEDNRHVRTLFKTILQEQLKHSGGV